MTDQRLPIVLFWHMHQPPYRDALSGRYVLPWTYLHAIKDYVDMASHLESVPGAKAVVNFTPVLIEQVEDLAAAVQNCLLNGTVLPDALLATLSAEPLPATPEERMVLLRACLRADRENLIRRHAHFEELVKFADVVMTPAVTFSERIPWVSDQYLYDLSVWYHIAWLAESVRREDPRVAALVAKARNFDAADRRCLLELIGELLSGVLPRFRQLAAHGRCELAVSPYSHPILPLLLDFQTARESEPAAPRPQHTAYPGGAERVRWHLSHARTQFERVFGHAPRGCWPSEGAISDAAVRAIETAGFDWLATSVSILRPSLELSGVSLPDDQDAAERLLNRAHSLPGSELECYFRHDAISDLIGFAYSRWHGDDAAANFAQEVGATAERTAGEPGRVLLVALDGENAWEYYPFNGWYFLRALYAALANHPAVRLTTLSEVVDEHRQAGITPAPLKHVRSGSWVYGTLSTWMGERDKNLGWDLLCEAKIAYDSVLAAGRLDAAQRERAAQQLAACEASDWYWWFGDYNPAEAVRDFDELFRHQLTSLYSSLGLPPPAQLAQRISIGRGAPEAGGVMRRS
ncbi:MAG TPA: glycoside hydrolase family 57 protein [Steroidobacteraceae bacterium]|nr:glycoside hydrolase family 57 protein [Steroidobacteraceae bacterium]